MVPGKAFEIVINIAALGIIAAWSSIMLCHIVFVRRAEAGQLTRPAFRLPLSPYTEFATIGFLASVIVLMWYDGGVGRDTVMLVPVIVIGLVVGWFVVRGRVRETSAAQDGAVDAGR